MIGRYLFLVLALAALTVALSSTEETAHHHDTTGIEIQTFVHDAIHWLENNSDQVSPLLWVITESEWGNELLFVVDDVGQRANVVSNDIHHNNDDGHNLCGCRSGESSTETGGEPGTCDNSNALAVVGIIGYIRPGHMGRFCLWEDGRIDSFMSRRVLHAAKVAPAPTLSELVNLIDDDGPANTCLPGAYRGLLFETMELLCFALGHKPALIRQRQQQMGGGGSNVSLLNGVPANLFVPHTKILWTWLLRQRNVWRGLSQVTWGSPEEGNPPFEHSLIFARDPGLGQKLVDLHVQDASVPHQADDIATARYIAQVGHALGYPGHEVRIYLETSGVIPVDMPREVIDNAMEEAFGSMATLDDNNNCNNQEGEVDNDERCSNRNQKFEELPGFRAFLESNEAQELSPKPMRDVVEPLDNFFFL